MSSSAIESSNSNSSQSHSGSGNQSAEANLLSQRALLAQGQAIGKLMAQALKYPELISLAAGFVDNATLPSEASTEAMRALSEDPSKLLRALQYDSTAGDRAFRECLAEWCYRDVPECRPDPDRIILTSGSNQFLHLLSEAVLDPGDIVITAAPTYFVYLGTLKGVGAKVIGVRADEDGMCMDALESTLAELRASGEGDRVKAIYTVTEFDNPAGSSLSLERRKRLLSLAESWHESVGPLLVLSDNAYELLRYEGESLPSLLSLSERAEEYVVELGTFSKSFSPGIRVGWGVVPKSLVDFLLDMKSNMDFGSPHFSQMLMHEVIASGALEQHLPKIRDGYRKKLDAMLTALEDSFQGVEGVHWRRPQGGLYVWLTLPEGTDTAEGGLLWNAAVEKGVLYVPGHHCFPPNGEPVARNTIRLSFGVQDAAGIRDGIQKLAAAVASVS
ncbi:MAG: PLP-dependent aminotransferase family protein [Planctomycetota bacterium]